MGKVVVIDDEENMRALAIAILEYAGFEVEGIAGAIDFLEKVNSGMLKPQDISLILLDVMMPGMTGTELCKHMKGDNKLKSIPIVLLTVMSYEQIGGGRTNLHEMGVVDYIKKPYNNQFLVEKVTEICGSP